MFSWNSKGSSQLLDLLFFFYFSIFDPKIHLANFLSVETLPTAVVAETEIQKGQPQKIGE